VVLAWLKAPGQPLPSSGVYEHFSYIATHICGLLFVACASTFMMQRHASCRAFLLAQHFSPYITLATQEFSKYMRFPMEKLYADPEGAAYKALGFNPGFMPDAQISPYAKLIPMLAGIGSPGTVQEVIRGYIGDREAKSVFDSPTPFDILGLGYQRPFELATLRLFNMFNVLSKWSDLSPPQQSLLTQQGGTIAFEGENTVFRHDDSGILKYADVDELLRTVLAAQEASGPPLEVTMQGGTYEVPPSS